MKISRGMQGKRNAIGSAIRLFRDPVELAEFKRRKPLTARVKQAISRSLKGKRRKRPSAASRAWSGLKGFSGLNSKALGLTIATGLAGGAAIGYMQDKGKPRKKRPTYSMDDPLGDLK